MGWRISIRIRSPRGADQVRTVYTNVQTEEEAIAVATAVTDVYLKGNRRHCVAASTNPIPPCLLRSSDLSLDEALVWAVTGRLPARFTSFPGLIAQS